MLDIVLKILSVLGIILLVLLAVLLVMVLLLLFFPITYKAFGRKKERELQAYVKVNWLFGLLRVRFFYPEPGDLTAKVLWLTVFDSSNPKKKPVEEKASTQKNSKENNTEEKNANEENESSEKSGEETTAKVQNRTPNNGREVLPNAEEKAGETKELEDTVRAGDKKTENTAAETENNSAQSFTERILAKYEKIKYTILKIYDKIKHIVENIAFYRDLLQEEQTKRLFRHALFRLERILKNIRPRKLKGDILFGTGSPDTTGYAYGVYGMVSAWLGNDINVTPDFTQTILEGELYAAGHITVFQLLWHSLRLAFDKRLRLLLQRVKTHKI